MITPDQLEYINKLPQKNKFSDIPKWRIALYYILFETVAQLMLLSSNKMAISPWLAHTILLLIPPSFILFFYLLNKFPILFRILYILIILSSLFKIAEFFLYI